jgi:hypothetical protein
MNRIVGNSMRSSSPWAFRALGGAGAPSEGEHVPLAEAAPAACAEGRAGQ